MLIWTIIIYLLLGFILFLILNYVDKKSQDNYLDNVIVANIFIIFSAGVLSNYNLLNNNDYIILVILFELLFRLFYSNYIREDNYFKDNKYNKNKYILMFITCCLVNYSFINKASTVFPKMENIKLIVWFLIVIYLYNYFKGSIENNFKKDRIIPYYKNEERIVVDYAKFKYKYSDKIKVKYEELIPLIFSIMIYENRKKPEFFRKMDNVIYNNKHSKHKYGIMQVDSYYPIDDISSISIAIKHLERIYSRLYSKGKFDGDISLILKKYYKDNVEVDKVLFIYNTINLIKSKF